MSGNTLLSHTIGTVGSVRICALPDPRFKTPGEALVQLQGDFNAWSEILTRHSIQLAYAVIAANWAVHGSANGVLNNCFAVWSMGIVFAFLGLNLAANSLMVSWHYDQYLYAEKDEQRWQNEFDSRQKDPSWPYTKNIEHLGNVMRWIKCVGPIIAAVLFILSLVHIK